ncbi:2'-5' RNA ligase family protein [Mycolicibacterium sediminis]|uniref:2'-5' RNA ligase n=1 Tax=Mycolicibacterium sediminis TaxID=1286180 RepID=A0A7I7QUY1_9MYCO|nr:2'-5' RNA ligase family protein [Mycolicibacterium sediminis]BBY29787.1 hypothetical protein MSEDJ_38830 [Mycolicibacterium sediminis]
MAHSLELLVDDATDAAVRREWAALADTGLPSQARHRSPTNRPHVTVAVSDHIAADVDPLLADVIGDLPLECRLGAPVVFGRRSLTLARLVLPSVPLLGFHDHVSAICAPHQTPGPFPHSLPGRWTPHVTLCRRLAPTDLPAALAVIEAVELVGVLDRLRRWDGDARVDTILGA